MNDYNLTREIPLDRLNTYISIGWSVLSQTDTTAFVGKTVKTKMPTSSDTCKIAKPYLIQRGSINRPFGRYTNETLSGAVSMDSMGAAEFEFGALPKSLRRIESQWPLYELKKEKALVAEILGKDFPVFLYANFDTVNQELEYVDNLIAAFNGTLYLKESLRACMISDKVTLTGDADFWWDIKNDLFFSFDKLFMARINNHLQASFRSMNTNI